MKRSARMTIQQATRDYEAWLAGQLEIVPADLALKHERMQTAVFPFLRATYYRWAQIFPERCHDLCSAPQVLAVGDLHVENFGTWRDAEGRLVWGINDFDETCTLPYTHDLVRLATSAHLAIEGGHLEVTRQEACESLLAGYREGLEAGGRPFVLAEHSHALRDMALARLREPARYWEKLEGLPTYRDVVPMRVVKALSAMLPLPDLQRRMVHRVAGLGSLGRQRFVALAEWQGGKIAREAKALAQSAVHWAYHTEGSAKVMYQTILDQSVRSLDPWVKVKRRWIVRRLAPDCSRIELADLPEEREETRLLRAMGWETANVHLGSRTAHALLVDLASRDGAWLHEAAEAMLAAVQEDWQAWAKDPVPQDKAAAPQGGPHRRSGGGGDGAADAGAGADGGADTHGRGHGHAAGGAEGRGAVAVSHDGADDKRGKAAGQDEQGGKAGKGGKAKKALKTGEAAQAGKAGKAGKAAKDGKAGNQAKPAKVVKVAKPGKMARAAKPAKVASSGSKPGKTGKAGTAAKAASGGKALKAGKGKAIKAGKAAKAGKPGNGGNDGKQG